HRCGAPGRGHRLSDGVRAPRSLEVRRRERGPFAGPAPLVPSGSAGPLVILLAENVDAFGPQLRRDPEINRALTGCALDRIARRLHDETHDRVGLLRSDPVHILSHLANAVVVERAAAMSIAAGAHRGGLMESDLRARAEQDAIGTGEEDQRARRRALVPRDGAKLAEAD